VGLAPTGKRRLFTAHAGSGRLWERDDTAGFDLNKVSPRSRSIREIVQVAVPT